jgi:C4-dicarboxylate transporter DctQ subunit
MAGEKIPNRIDTLYHKMSLINKATTVISGIIIFIVTFLIFFDVFLRYVFNSPSIWITEVSSYLFLYIIFLATAYALQEDQHISVSFLLDLLGTKLQKVANVLASLVGIFFCLVLVWQTTRMALVSYREGWVSPTMLAVPLVWLYLVMIFGSLALCLTYLLKTAIYVKGLTAKK